MHETDSLRLNGLLTLGSRFRRLGDRMQAETQVILNRLDPRVPSAWHPVIEVLDRCGPQTVGQIAGALGVTQPGVTRTVAALQRLGLVAIGAVPGDRRARSVALSDEGQALVARARAGAWAQVQAAVADLCQGFGPELLGMLDTIEDRLAQAPLASRVEQDR